MRLTRSVFIVLVAMQLYAYDPNIPPVWGQSLNASTAQCADSMASAIPHDYTVESKVFSKDMRFCAMVLRNASDMNVSSGPKVYRMLLIFYALTPGKWSLVTRAPKALRCDSCYGMESGGEGQGLKLSFEYGLFVVSEEGGTSQQWRSLVSSIWDSRVKHFRVARIEYIGFDTDSQAISKYVIRYSSLAKTVLHETFNSNGQKNESRKSSKTRDFLLLDNYDCYRPSNTY